MEAPSEMVVAPEMESAKTLAYLESSFGAEAVSVMVGGTVVDVIHGWEPRTYYLVAEGVTRGQAKSAVAWDAGEAFTDMRCRKVWMQEREIREDEACDYWLDDWHPGYVAWVECKRDAPNAIAYWKVEWPRANW